MISRNNSNFKIIIQRAKLKLINKKKTCQPGDFAVSTDLKLKMKGNDKIEKYLNLAWELKKKHKEH